MDRGKGYLTALLGVLIAVVSIVVGVGGGLGEATREHWGAFQVLLSLGMFGGFAGLWVFLEGAVMAASNKSKDVSSGGRKDSSPGSLKHCRCCGMPVVGKPKTCRWCGVDVDSL